MSADPRLDDREHWVCCRDCGWEAQAAVLLSIEDCPKCGSGELDGFVPEDDDPKRKPPGREPGRTERSCNLATGKVAESESDGKVEVDHCTVAQQLTAQIRSELNFLGHRHGVPSRHLDFIMTLALRLAGSMVSADRQRHAAAADEIVATEALDLLRETGS